MASVGGTPCPPNLASLGGREGHPSQLLQVCSHLLGGEDLSARPQAWGCLEVLERKGPSSWGKHASTHKNMFALRVCPGPTRQHVPRLHRDARISSLPPTQQGICVCLSCLSSVGGEAYPEDVLYLTWATGDKHALLGAEGAGGSEREGGGRLISSLPSQAPPCVVWWPRVTVRQLRHFQGLHGVWEGGGGERRHEGTGVWGTNPHRNSLRGPTCVQGGKKKTSPCTWENTPPCEKAHLHAATHPRLVSQWRGPSAPQLFQGPGPEKRTGLWAWERHPWW